MKKLLCCLSLISMFFAVTSSGGQEIAEWTESQSQSDIAKNAPANRRVQDMTMEELQQRLVEYEGRPGHQFGSDDSSLSG